MIEESDIKSNFIRNIIDEDIKANKNDKKVTTRFPPEPNGYLHIGHAKSICLNFGLSKDYNGTCHLRFDDTNPSKESQEYVDAIIKDVKWLGFDWKSNLFHSSDYFEQLYNYATELIKMDKAFVCSQTQEEMRIHRGDLTTPGKESPHRGRSIEENLDLFSRMRAGEFEDGKYILRAKIDMSSPNMNLRDPAIYRIKKVTHQRTGDTWPIYPMYDYCHCLSDAIERITHSLCTLEFEDHRPLYDWFIETLKIPSKPQQIEFAKLNLEFTMLSKRNLLRLVEEGFVTGWDDPRMPTISGMRRRGVTAFAIADFCHRIGVTKKDSLISYATFSTCVRSDLENNCKRVFGVVDPLKVVITNYPDDESKIINAKYHPKDESLGKRDISFSNELYIERSDFMEDPPKKFFRLGPERSARLKYGYVITCDEIIKDETGKVVQLNCTYNKETFGGVTPEGMKKVKGIINWVDAKTAIRVQTRLYDHLFLDEDPLAMNKDKDIKEFINPNSMEIKDSYMEASMAGCQVGDSVQFERQGYFTLDGDSDLENNNFVFNRITALRDSSHK